MHTKSMSMKRGPNAEIKRKDFFKIPSGIIPDPQRFQLYAPYSLTRRIQISDAERSGPGDHSNTPEGMAGATLMEGTVRESKVDSKTLLECHFSKNPALYMTLSALIQFSESNFTD